VKADIHPDYVDAVVTCSCGNTFQTRSTISEIHLELCNECHPFFTGKQKLVDSGGRVERFQRRYGKTSFTRAAASADTPAPEAASPAAAETPADEADAAEPADADADTTADA
jgi:large subunit ribosomal protein L31